METWYRTRFTDTIDPVAVLRSTEKTVILAGTNHRGPTERKALRQSSFERYFPTWGEAKGYLIAAAEERVVAAQKDLDEAPARFARILEGRRKTLARVKALELQEAA